MPKLEQQLHFSFLERIWGVASLIWDYGCKFVTDEGGYDMYETKDAEFDALIIWIEDEYE